MLLVSLSFKWKGPAGALVSPCQTGDDLYSIVFVLWRGLMVRKTLNGSVDVKNRHIISSRKTANAKSKTLMLSIKKIRFFPNDQYSQPPIEYFKNQWY